MRRRTLLKAVVVAPALTILGGVDNAGASGSGNPGSGAQLLNASASSRNSLVFDKSNYTVKSKTVSGTGRGTKTVKYRYYEAIPYVASPIDVTYQALNVSVPIEINGKVIDAAHAPILFDINVGGYTSSPVSGASGASSSGGSTPGATPGTNSGGPPSGSPPTGASPPGASSSAGPGIGVAPGQGTTVNGAGGMVDNGDLALAAGWVCVSPGCRGRDNERDGRYFGKAPAAIVDLKAAVRYVRYNKGRLPGNSDWIVASGGSAGGALSTLLAASGDSPMYDSYLTPLGAADVSDAIFASASYSPITDLDHADMAYEWMWGTLPYDGATVDQTISDQLKGNFTGYLESLGLKGINGFGKLTSSNYAAYMMTNYLEPSATKYLAAFSATTRASYLNENDWITWSGGKAAFTWSGFLDHVGTRLKTVPAFDSFTLSNAENIEFGDATTNARHFTLFSLRHATNSPHAQLASDLPPKIEMMNPMYFLEKKNPRRARHWWIRTGSLDTNTAHTIVGNLAAATTSLGDNVNSALYWDGGHAVNEDAPNFISWIARITGYPEAQ